ncbi:tonB-system energizer ExbB [Henriciella aquimarina]|uniref:tonB-system energizer ExbB n=1 Tax=Henriciella aquimarina TaxID=545261 RepID=UPI00146F3C08|nr:tonB-system energizer ExbB [Henriciella aquimarina]
MIMMTPAPALIAQTSPMNADISPRPAVPHDLSPWGMFMAADWVVKSVMIGLILASIATWTVWLVKTLEFRKVAKGLERDLPILSGIAGYAEAAAAGLQGEAGRGLLEVTRKELKLSSAGQSDEGIKERLASALSREEARFARVLSGGTGVLASIGAVAPFVGLFGTVWGIMNAFIGISETQTTNLAVVAPGIAEALLATALGLVAAIPAVVIYNYFARRIAALKAGMADMSAAIMRIISRDLDCNADLRAVTLKVAE